MQKDTAYKVYSDQLLLLRKYQDIFRDNMRTALMAHTKNLTSAILKEKEPLVLDALLPPLLTIIPDIYIKEDILAKALRSQGKPISEHALANIRKEKRTATLPYVIMHLRNGASALEYPENKINFLEQIFFFMYTGEFPPGDITYKKIIIA